MKKVKKSLVLISTIICGLGLSACGSSDNEKDSNVVENTTGDIVTPTVSAKPTDTLTQSIVTPSENLTTSNNSSTVVVPTTTVEPEIPSSEGLELTLASDKKSYVVSGIGTCSDTNVVIPNQYEGLPVTAINKQAFNKNTTIENVVLQSSIKEIGVYAFANSNLKSINIPKNINTLGGNIFDDCKYLSKITVDNDNTKYDSRNDCNAIIETSTDTLVAGSISTVIPSDIKVIGLAAFKGRRSLKNITIPQTVTEIRNFAFYECVSINNIVIPSTCKTIGNSAFYGCYGITKITFEEGLETLNGGAFNLCSGLTTVVLPESLKTIGNKCFYNCSNLTSITIGANVESIGTECFNYSSVLKTINYGGTQAQWASLNKGLSITGGATVHCSDGDIFIY